MPGYAAPRIKVTPALRRAVRKALGPVDGRLEYRGCPGRTVKVYDRVTLLDPSTDRPESGPMLFARVTLDRAGNVAGVERCTMPRGRKYW